MTVTYARGHDVLEALVRARMRYDGEGFTELFADEAEVSLDPFTPPLVGHNALRAYLLRAAEAERDYDQAIERHKQASARRVAFIKRRDDAQAKIDAIEKPIADIDKRLEAFAGLGKFPQME